MANKKYKYGLKIKARKGGVVNIRWNDPSSEVIQKIFDILYNNVPTKTFKRT